MNYDYYSEARQLATMLSEERLSDWSMKITRSLEDGVTSTEILMMVRWNLTNFLSTEQGSRKLAERARQLCQKIDAALS